MKIYIVYNGATAGNRFFKTRKGAMGSIREAYEDFRNEVPYEKIPISFDKWWPQEFEIIVEELE